MRNLRLVLTTIGVVVVLVAFSACDEKEKEIFKRMENHSKSLQSFRANIRLETFNSQIGETDVSEGDLVYVQLKDKFGLRIDWTKPIAESLFMINKSVLLYRPRLNTAYQGKVEKTKYSVSINDGLAFFRFSKEYLKANYNVKNLGEEKINNGISTWHLKFTPKTTRDYKSVEVWVDGNGALNQVKVIQKNNDSIKVMFTKIKLNVTVRGNEFVPKYPKTTKIVKF